jgi:prepilin-type N-terminal cleavage/methylation domain-containing protein
MRNSQGLGHHHPAQGFSLVEVMIAAAVLFVLLSSANRTLMMSMANSRQGASRMQIESAILNDIEIIQGIDTSLSSDLNGCGSGGGSTYLKGKIESMNPVASDAPWERQLVATDATLLRITYSFSISEMTGDTSTEQRIIEINPSFLSECPLP